MSTVAAAFPNLLLPRSRLATPGLHRDLLPRLVHWQSASSSRSLLPTKRPCLRTGPFSFPRYDEADRLSLSAAHGWHVRNRIADQTVKIYISPCRWNAAPFPPPSDPREATPNRSRILLPRLRFTGPVQSSSLHLGLTFDLASALSSGSNFGWSLFFARTLESAWQRFSKRVCAPGRGVEYSCSTDRRPFVVEAAPPRSDAPAFDP